MNRFALAVCASAVSMLAACSSPSTLVAPTTIQPFARFDSLAMQIGRPEVAKIPRCNGQKSTKDYAGVGAKPLSTKGGTLCVPLFKGWGGSISYPGPTTSGVTMSLISSTSAYSGAAWPPSAPGQAIFYLRYTLNDNGVEFGSKVSALGDLASNTLKAKRKYTIYAAQEATASLWQGLAECYETAASGKYGPDLSTVGKAVFAGHQLFNASGVIEIIPGQVGSATKC
jgi:hypothetical protein